MFRKNPSRASKVFGRLYSHQNTSSVFASTRPAYSQVHTLRLSSTSLQRLPAVAVMAAAKFLDEPFYSNKWWCELRMRSVPSPSSPSSPPSCFRPPTHTIIFWSTAGAAAGVLAAAKAGARRAVSPTTPPARSLPLGPR